MRAHRPLQGDREDDRAHLRHVGLLIEPRKIGGRGHREPEILPERFTVALQHLEAGAEHAVGQHHATVVGDQHVAGIDGAVREPARPGVQRGNGVDDERGELEHRGVGNHLAGRFQMRKQMREADT